MSRRITPANTFLRQIVFASSLIALSILVSGCTSNGGGASMRVKSPATGEKELRQKSGYAYAVTKTFTDASGQMTTAASYRVYLANYDLDAGNFAMTLDKPLTADDQMRVVLSLVGDQGTNDKSALKTGTYAAKADKFMKVEDVAIFSRKGGADKTVLDRSVLSGDARVSSVSGDTITGEVDLTSGAIAIKGPFSARILVRK
jgi:hypothetical protein